jgi:NAD(P)-dependent dehydrogenase (short-subunit alcohol dehydrogenase family)
MNSKELPVAIVTGASGGIGRAAARALSRAGYQVFGTSRREAPVADSGITMLVCDVTNDDSVKRAVETVVTRAGRIDVLVNNAGRGLIGGAEESSVGQARDLFDVNVFGILRVTNEVLPIMRRQGHGRIINISSVLGFLPGPYTALYASTKHAVEGYSESLDHEVRAFGIRVSLVEPAFTRTALEENSAQPDRMSSIYDQGRLSMNETFRHAIAAGDPAEAVGATVVQAATDRSPRMRYTPGKIAGRLRFLRRYVPERAFATRLRKEMNLPA